jgi:type II secretory ATPase GspE/PulE/Tfp pilus assembly ATPase PilB-like protein
VSNLFKMAVEKGASDIHIEPTEQFLLIRFRKD